MRVVLVEPRGWQRVVVLCIYQCIAVWMLLRAIWHYRRWRASKHYLHQLDILEPLPEPLRSTLIENATRIYKKAMRE